MSDIRNGEVASLLALLEALQKVNAEQDTEIDRLVAERIELTNWLNTHYPHVGIAFARWEEEKK